MVVALLREYYKVWVRTEGKRRRGFLRYDILERQGAMPKDKFLVALEVY